MRVYSQSACQSCLCFWLQQNIMLWPHMFLQRGRGGYFKPCFNCVFNLNADSAERVHKLFTCTSHTSEWCRDLDLHSPNSVLSEQLNLSFLIGLSHHVIFADFTHLTCQVSQMTFCPQFESKFWAHFILEFMAFSWCLWRAHWFLLNSLDIVCRNISSKQVTSFILPLQSMKGFPFIHHMYSVLLGHTVDLSWYYS